jgi:hypothetical protein
VKIKTKTHMCVKTHVKTHGGACVKAKLCGVSTPCVLEMVDRFAVSIDCDWEYVRTRAGSRDSEPRERAPQGNHDSESATGKSRARAGHASHGPVTGPGVTGGRDWLDWPRD